MWLFLLGLFLGVAAGFVLAALLAADSDYRDAEVADEQNKKSV